MTKNNIETTWLMVQLGQDIYGLSIAELPEFAKQNMDEDITAETDGTSLRDWLRQEIREVNLKNVIQVRSKSSKSLDEILDDPLTQIWITDITKL